MSSDSQAEGTGIEVIRDKHAIQRLYATLVQSAKSEIQLFLPTTSAFLREEKMGIIQSLLDAGKRGVKIRFLTLANEIITSKMEAMVTDSTSNIEIRRIRHAATSGDPHEARTKILVIDKREYLIVELNDDSKETFVEAVQSAIHSTTRSTVMSYLTLFDSLWEQSDLYEKLEAHGRMQKEFINIAAHELRTPIQPILGVAEMLEEEFAAGAEESTIMKEDLDLLVRNARRLEYLAQSILEVSRIESNSFNLNKERFDISEKIRNLIADMKILAPMSEQVRIEVAISEPILVEADRTRIYEVISNLVRNAIKFTDEGTITIKAQRHDGEAVIEVKDIGKGIDADIMPKLFSKFATKSNQGTGLGLFVSKKIVEAHGGRIWAENNRDGRGATFSFTLPLS
ncbi:MAG TPA: ATP-binding protein [Nitrososphaera sp.]